MGIIIYLITKDIINDEQDGSIEHAFR